MGTRRARRTARQRWIQYHRPEESFNIMKLGSPKPPRRAAYALPTLFTAGNIFLGFLSIFQAFEAAMRTAAGDPSAAANFDNAAKFIGIAVAFDGLDGRIARLTNT